MPSAAGPERDLIGYGRHVPQVEWPDGARVALSIVVNYEEGSEPSHPAGDGRNAWNGELGPALGPEYRDLAVESMFEYGSRAGIWRIARLLDEFGIRCTFFATAVALELNPAVAAYIAERGHEPCFHGYRWDEAWLLSRDEERERLEAGIASIERTVGSRPRGCYCKGSASPNTRELLVEEGGFLYDSDAYNDDLPYFVEVGEHRHLVIPYTLVQNDARFVAAPGFHDPSSFLATCRSALDQLREEGKTHPRMMTVAVHPRHIGQAARIGALRELIDYATGLGDVWFPRRIDIAEWWIANSASF